MRIANLLYICQSQVIKYYGQGDFLACFVSIIVLSRSIQKAGPDANHIIIFNEYCLHLDVIQ